MLFFHLPGMMCPTSHYHKEDDSYRAHMFFSCYENRREQMTIRLLTFIGVIAGLLGIAGVAFAHPAHDRPAFISKQSAVASPAMATADTTPADIYLSPHFVFAVASSVDVLPLQEKSVILVAIVHRKVTPTRVWPQAEGFIQPFAAANAVTTVHGGSNDTARMVIFQV